MISFLKVERRDYQPVFDVYVVGVAPAYNGSDDSWLT